MSMMVLQSIITCPECGFQKEETMPISACQFFYECTQCKSVLKPKAGDCCIFCSYGTEICPPKQEAKECC
ncbi:MAG: GDCCVxC domain-containing (seleno)protein [Bacteroidota bacterium]